MKVLDALQRIEAIFDEADLFFGHGTENAGDEAWWLVHFVVFGPGAPFQEPSESLILSELQWQTTENLARQRVETRKPLAYLLKEAWFCGLAFSVDENVLVPRSPIAELIEQGFYPFLEQAPKRILDLCTGSGCIGIATAYVFPEAQVVISDISQEALTLAQHNISRHRLEERVTAVKSDIFDDINGQFDLIVTNPPYVPQTEYELLPPEYINEPVLGLVSEQEGLDIPQRILQQAGEFLQKEGLLILEVGNTWQALEKNNPELPFLWLDFEFGGHGVCAFQAGQLSSSSIKD